MGYEISCAIIFAVAQALTAGLLSIREGRMPAWCMRVAMIGASRSPRLLKGLS
jgi:hypothetical protein